MTEVKYLLDDNGSLDLIGIMATVDEDKDPTEALDDEDDVDDKKNKDEDDDSDDDDSDDDVK